MIRQEIPRTTPTREEFRRLAGTYDLIPVARIVTEVPDPLRLYRLIREGSTGFILESGKGGRYSYVGKGSLAELVLHDQEEGLPLERLRAFLAGTRCAPHPDLSNFAGGCVGFLSYDLARSIERLPSVASDPLALPAIRMIVPECFVEIDHREGRGRIVLLASGTDSDPDTAYDEALAALDEIEGKAERACAGSGGAQTEATGVSGSADGALPEVEAHLTQEEFERMVERAIEYVFAGDIFQVNLSVRFSRRFDEDPLRLYGALRRINPAPYMAFLEFDDCAIVSSSPELLLKVDGEELSTRPIAGTRKRGRDEREDQEKIEELIGNEKERAEHLMLVDLERNDLGRVSEYGSVVVDEFMTIEKYSHVIHIVSNVRGRLAAGRDIVDAIAAVFPGGTITGAPKVRAMEIIEELEPERRGIYTGSVGWIGFNGDAELNIAIRTILVKEGRAWVQAGAGIVADSVPPFEYKESLRKAEAMFRALAEVEG